MVNRETYGDVVVDTLEYYRRRTNDSENSTPVPYQRIQRRLNKLKNEGKKILVDIENSSSVQTVVLNLEYVHSRWAMGTCESFYDGGIVHVPYTIHYSDIVCRDSKIKVISEGDNPIEGTKQI